MLSDCKIVVDGLIYPSSILFNADETKVYIADVLGSEPTRTSHPTAKPGIIRECKVNNDGGFFDCKKIDAINKSTVRPYSLALNDAENKLYIGGRNDIQDAHPNDVMLCDISSDAPTCESAYAQNTQPGRVGNIDDLFSATSLTFDWANNMAYVVDAWSESVEACSIDDGSKLNHCFTTSVHGLDMPESVTFDAVNKLAYVTEYFGDDIQKCDVKADGMITGVCQKATVDGEEGVTGPFKVKVSGDRRFN